MWLEGTPILHDVDTHTGFQNVTVLQVKNPNNMCSAFVECWATLYLGYQNIIRLDQEVGFTAKHFRDLATAHGTTLQFSGAQSQNFMGAGETYHEPLVQYLGYSG